MGSNKKKSIGKKRLGFMAQLGDERLPKVIGVLCILFAIYLAVAFVSYFYTWQEDQDKVLTFSWQVLIQSDLSVANWLGRLGALVSNAFFYWGFGVPSIVFIFLLSKLGIALVRRRSLVPVFQATKYAIVFITFFSLSLEFFLAESNFAWGGAFGEALCYWLTNFMGQVGLLLLLIFSIAFFIVWQFNPNIDLILAKFSLPGIGKLDMDFFKSVGEDFNFGSSSNTNPKTKSFEAAKRGKTPENDSEKEKTYTALRPSSSAEGAIPNTADRIQEPGISLDIPESLSTIERNTNNLSNHNLELETVKASETAEPAFTTVSAAEIAKEHAESKPQIVATINEKNFTEPYDPTLDLSRYKYPEVDILENYADQKFEIDRSELEANKDQIIETLLNYKIEITKIRATIGPTVTLYEIVPAPGVKISKIKNLEDDIALSLAALGIRIIAPIPGKGTIGIEVPNKKKQIVSLKEVLKSDKYINAKMDLPIALGKTISNEVFVADLAKMPHLLVAGATGQGKSVGINTILMSLLYKKHPSQVKLVLIDPKKVELFPYTNLHHHYLAILPDQEEPIVTETAKVINTLNSLCIEMDNRYDLLKRARSRNIKEYNEKFTKRKLNPKEGHKFLPYIILVIDEFADLIMTAGKEVELPIARLAQLARAIGIHLIIATQRPSVNIITGTIKANFPARLAFKVTSKIDSRTILDTGGAEQLIGRGDMLLNIGSNVVRLQCAFVDTAEVERVIDHIGDQQGFPEPFYLPEYKTDDDVSSDGSNLKISDLDEMFEQAAQLVIGNQHGSTSMIQRKLQLGYNRAGRIMDQMEALGLVGPAQGSKPREVMFYSIDEFDNFYANLKKNK
jgi:S-DNA-T family DNA segregation ATPase FtsK/SpoIIIE